MNGNLHCPLCGAAPGGPLDAELRKMRACLSCNLDDAPSPECEGTRSAILSELTLLYGPERVNEAWARVLGEGNHA